MSTPAIKRLKLSGFRLLKGFSKELGDGTIDWGNVRAALKQINYSGWATAEVGKADRTRLADIARRTDSILDL